MDPQSLPSSSSASRLPIVTPVSKRLLSGARIGVVIGGHSPQGKAFIEQLLSSAGEEWVLKVTPHSAASGCSPDDAVLPFPELSVDLWAEDDRKWREQEENIVNSMRGAYGVYVATFPFLEQAKSWVPHCTSDRMDSETEIRMAQRLGRCAQHSGVHHFVFSGRNIRSEPCVMSLCPPIPSVLFLKVDTLLEELVNMLEAQETNTNPADDQVIGVISTKDLGCLAARSFIEPQKFRLPGKVKIDPVSTEMGSKRELLARLRSGDLLNRLMMSDVQPNVTKDTKMRMGMTTTLHLLTPENNPATRR